MKNKTMLTLVVIVSGKSLIVATNAHSNLLFNADNQHHKNFKQLRGRPQPVSRAKRHNQPVHKLQQQHHIEFRGIELRLSRIK